MNQSIATESRKPQAVGRIRRLALSLALTAFAPCLLAASMSGHTEGRSEYVAPFAEFAPLIDGIASEPVWNQADWRRIDQLWLGEEYPAEDFSGRFKVVWNEDAIYIVAEIVDDVLFDKHRPPLEQYWDDDCLEVFIDEDHSGGEHQFNHNAFAYHLSLDNQAVDIGTDGNPRLYNHHVNSRWKAHGNTIVWELAIDVYADDYVDDSDDNNPVTLHAKKIIGLMLAWCDNDGSDIREKFVGSETVPSGPKDRGWIDAGLFGAVVLGEPGL